MPQYEDLVRRALEAQVRAGEICLDSERIRLLAEILRRARLGVVSIVRRAWCERIRVGEEWLHLEAIGSGQQLIRSSLLARASHGICPDCFAEQERLRQHVEVQAASVRPDSRS